MADGKYKVNLSGPDIVEADIEAVEEVLRSRHLALGPKLGEFEERFAEAASKRFGVGVNSGTSALHLIMLSLGVGKGDEVVTTPFSFISSANCILMVGAKPVFVDIQLPNYNIDVPSVMEYVAKAEKKPKAVIVVDVFGQPSDWSELESFCADKGIALVEDSCEAIGARVAGRPAGAFGDAGAFAFYPNKQLTTGEGGCIVTDDEDLARNCRSLRNQGRGEGGQWLQHRQLGYNFRISDMNCALGISQLSRLSEIVEMRSKVARRYEELLRPVEGVITPSVEPEVERMSWFVYVIRLSDDYNGMDRDRIISGLRDRGIGCSNYFAPIHLMPFYREDLGFDFGDFPKTEAVASRTIALPFYNRLQREDQIYVVDALKELL